MSSGYVWSRLMVVLAMGVAVAMAAGCGQQQLEERNVALQKQLDQALGQNADLQTQNGTLQAQNDALAADLDKARAAAAAKAGQPASARAAKAKPEFGGGVETAMVGESLYVTLPDTILFAPGKADLTPAAKKVLDQVAAVLNKDYAGDKIRVEGHTDNQPISKTKNLWQDNWDLSCNRSMTVLRHLVSNGVDPKRVYAAGFGFYKPVASNDTVAGRTKNRRVVIVVSPQ